MKAKPMNLWWKSLPENRACDRPAVQSAALPDAVPACITDDLPYPRLVQADQARTAAEGRETVGSHAEHVLAPSRMLMF